MNTKRSALKDSAQCLFLILKFSCEIHSPPNYINTFALTFSRTGVPVNTLLQGWRTFLRKRAQIVDNFLRNTFACPWEL
jgi:hypothetical protein